MGSNPTLSARLVRQSLVVLVAILILTISTPTVHAECGTTYVVKQGDSWWQIAEQFHVKLAALLRMNNAKQSTMLKSKDLICLPTSAPISNETFTPEQVTQIIRDIWPDILEDRAIYIAKRESKLNPSAIGIPNRCCYGLFQIYYRWHKEWLPQIGVTSSRQLLDPTTNAIAALEIYRRNRGWRAWE